MPLAWDTVDVVLEGLDEKTDRASVATSNLVVAENVVYEPGRMDKRRGYQRLQLVDDVEGGIIDPLNLFLNVATVEDELLLLGYDQLYSMGSVDDAIDGAGLILRGPISRCTLLVEQVATGKETA